MDIRPIRTEEDHAAALGEIECLWGSAVGSAEGDRLDVLATLIDSYESQHFPIEAADPVDVLKTHMEMTGRSRGDLAELFGSRSRASEVLNHKRALSMDMAHKLHRLWGIPAEVLIEPYALKMGSCGNASAQRATEAARCSYR